jgi:hypothetical protein
MGEKIEPLFETSTNKVPIIGPVHEKDTRASVKAINNILTKPTDLSALASIFDDHEEGNVISNAPKNEIAKTTRSPKNNKLKNALVERLFNALAPKKSVINIPNET